MSSVFMQRPPQLCVECPYWSLVSASDSRLTQRAGWILGTASARTNRRSGRTGAAREHLMWTFRFVQVSQLSS